MAFIRCNNCGNNNPLEARFCRFCGSPLVSAPPEQPQSLADEIHQLHDLITSVNTRLEALENKLGLAETRPPPVAVSPLPAAAPPVPAEEIPLPETPPAIVKVKRAPARRREWEQALGGNWLARIGVLALIIGIGFFLKYAFDNNWIGPAARVIIGVIAGLVMLGLGNWWRKRYPIMTRVLSGGGIAVLYLSIFASFATYHLINISLAVVFLLIVSAISAVLARRYDSMALAILGIIGAFFAPYILGAFGERGPRGSGETGQAVQLLVYLIVVDLGVLLLSTFRNWRWFTLLALGCSLITYGVWYGEFDRQVSIATAEIGITAVFLIFVGATSLFHIILRRTTKAFDYILMEVTAAAYFSISLGLMGDEYRAWMGGFALLLAVFYGLLSYFAYRRNRDNSLLHLFALGTAIIFFTTAIPMQFSDKAWATVSWAAEAAVLTWLSFKARPLIYRIFGYIVFFIVAIRLLGFDTWAYTGKTMPPVFNERFLTFIIAIGAMWLSAFLLWKHRQEGKAADSLVIMAMADFFTLWIIGGELYGYSTAMKTTSANLGLIMLLVLAGATIMNHIIWRRKPHVLDIVLAIVNAITLGILIIIIWDALRGWMGLSYLLLAIFYGLLSSLIRKRNGENTGLCNMSMAIAMVFLTVAIPIQLGDSAWTTIAWAAEMAAVSWIGFVVKLPRLRYMSYAVFIAMALRMLIFDTTVNINDFRPVLNERFLAFIIGIAATYLTVHLLWRKREIIPEWSSIAPFLLIVASLLTLWLISFEVWDSFSVALRSAGQAAKEGLRNAQNLSLTAVWAVYAVAGLVVGIWRRWRAVRIGSLVFLAVPIIKVFVYDVFKLETSYRIGAFVGLGLLLLISAYLYQRYSKIIKGVFTE